MYKFLILHSILLFALIQGTIIPAIKTPVKTSLNDEVPKDVENTTNKAISEGGAIVPSNPLTLSSENESLPKNIVKELSSNKGKSIVPRKGVVYNPAEDVNHDKIDQILNTTKTNATSTSNSTVEILKPIKLQVLNESSTLNDTQKLNITKSHKPLILSHEALAKMDEINHLELDEDGPDIKVHSVKATGHPEMIMPIVITMLVVPMFAVLGYMAVKRGQEAWKNRHYKRMDFLLDGMYND